MMFTHTGRRVNPLALTPADVRVEDLAHALALCNRFAGHSCRPISVAQHSVWAARLVLDEPMEPSCPALQVVLQALLHDASEAYLGDVTKWVKRTPAFAAYRELEARVQRTVYRAFGLPKEELPAVKAVDKLLVRYEMLRGFGPGFNVGLCNPEADADYPPLTPAELARFDGWEFWDWERARAEFLNTYYELTDPGRLPRTAGDWGDCWRQLSERG